MSNPARDAEADLVPWDDLVLAHESLRGALRRTPLLEVALPGATAGVSAKAENLQITGSFKLRGALNAVRRAAAAGATGIATYSAGNHGRAVAYASRLAGVPSTVVMPETATALKIAQTRAAGAEVVVCDPDQIVSRCQEIRDERRLAFVHPFDDAAVIAGQSTFALEALEQLGDAPLDAVLVPVGGGGLLAGTARVLKRLRPGTRVIGVEPELAADLAEGFRLGRPVAWDRERTRRTIADGLRSPRVGQLNWAHISALVDDVITVSEESIGAALAALATETNTVVEPSGAVAAAAIVQYPDVFAGERVLVPITGGNIDLGTFAELVARA